MHWLFWQHPLAHEVASQVHWKLGAAGVPTFAHSWFAAHVGAQAAPPEPHVLTPSPVWHTPFASQQPVGHVFASQTHCPCPLHSLLPELRQSMQLPPPF